MTFVVPDDTGRAAHDFQRALPLSVAQSLYGRLRAELGAGPVVDVGGGSGVVATELARAGCSVVLTDIVDWRSVALPFVRCDAVALPFAAGSASGVHVARLLAHVIDWRTVLRECVRVARPDGALCISVGDKPVEDSLRSLVDEAAGLAAARGLRESEVVRVHHGLVGDYLARRGWSDAVPFEFGADVPVTPREFLTSSLGNPFRWAPGQDLGVLPGVIADVLRDTGDADIPVARDRTVRYVVYRAVG